MFENFLFSPEKEEKVSVNTLKSEHLSPGVSPIYCCLETFDDSRNEEDETEVEKAYRERKVSRDENGCMILKSFDSDNLDYVDYNAGSEDLTKKNYKAPKTETYAISPITEKDKMSRFYVNCNGVLAAGIDKVSGKKISFLSHEDTNALFGGDKEIAKQFSLDLKEQLMKLKERSVPGTIDAIIFGGNYLLKINEWARRKKYRDSINLLSSEISDVLGFSPVVIVGPKIVPGNDNFYYDNEHRRAFLIRNETGNTSSESYLPIDLKKQEEKWEEEQVKSVWERIKEVFD